MLGSGARSGPQNPYFGNISTLFFSYYVHIIVYAWAGGPVHSAIFEMYDLPILRLLPNLRTHLLPHCIPDLLRILSNLLPTCTGHESHHGIYPDTWIYCDSVMAWPITTQIAYGYARSQKYPYPFVNGSMVLSSYMPQAPFSRPKRRSWDFLDM